MALPLKRSCVFATESPPDTSQGATLAKHMMSKEKNVETYVRSLAAGKRALGQTLRRLVKAQAPHLVEVMKWGNVCWVGTGNVCLVHVADDHLDFAFFMGASLPDPAGILGATGSFSEWSKSARRRTFVHARLLRSSPAPFPSTAGAPLGRGRSSDVDCRG